MKRELILNLLYTFLTSVFGFIQNKFFIQYMGIETLGMMKLFSQLLAYLNIIEMGIGAASTYALYNPLEKKDYKKLSIIVNTMENIYKKIGIVLFILGILCIPIIPFFMRTTISFSKVYFYWILYVLNTSTTYLFIKYIILFTANQEYLYVRQVQTCITIFFRIFQIVFMIYLHSFFVYILLLIMDSIFQWIILRKHYKRNYDYIEKTTEKLDEIKKDIKNIIWHKIGGLVVFNTDLLLISKFVSLKIVGIYASYQMIIQVLETIINVLKGVLTPKIGKFISGHTKEEVYEYYKELNILFSFIATFFTYCTYKLINEFIILWLGKEFLLDSLTLKLICVNLWIYLFRWNLEMFKSGAGFFDDKKSPIFESIINLIISIILGIKLGLNGIIIGTIVSNVIVILIYKPYLVFKRCFAKGLKEYIIIYGKTLFIMMISINLLLFINDHCINQNIYNWTDWIKKAIKISLLTFNVTLIIFLLDKEFRNLLKKYKKS